MKLSRTFGASILAALFLALLAAPLRPLAAEWHSGEELTEGSAAIDPSLLSELSEEELSRFSLSDLAPLLEGIDLASLLGEGSSSSSSSSSSEGLGALGTILELLGGTSHKIKDCTFTPIPDQTYTGKEVRPNPTITAGGLRLKKGQDYTLRYENNTSVGTAKCIVLGKGSYEGQKTLSFKIVKKTGSQSSSSSQKDKSFTVKLSQTSYVYTGKPKKPTVKVSLSSKSVPSSGYQVTYKNNIKVGIATVTVKGTGDYKGCSGEASFKITLKKTGLKTASSKEAGGISLTWTADTQADGYQIWASTNKSFSSPQKLDVKGGSKSSAQFSGLTSGKKYYVRIRSYKDVGDDEWLCQWSAAKEVTVK